MCEGKHGVTRVKICSMGSTNSHPSYSWTTERDGLLFRPIRPKDDERGTSKSWVSA